MSEIKVVVFKTFEEFAKAIDTLNAEAKSIELKRNQPNKKLKEVDPSVIYEQARSKYPKGIFVHPKTYVAPAVDVVNEDGSIRLVGTDQLQKLFLAIVNDPLLSMKDKHNAVCNIKFLVKSNIEHFYTCCDDSITDYKARIDKRKAYNRAKYNKDKTNK